MHIKPREMIEFSSFSVEAIKETKKKLLMPELKSNLKNALRGSAMDNIFDDENKIKEAIDTRPSNTESALLIRIFDRRHTCECKYT
jgi:hypothetical protein